MSEVTIAGRKVGPGSSCLIIAELSGNHHGDYAEAEALIRAAASAGADAVKSQLMVPSDLTIDSDAPPFRLTWNGQETTLWRLYSETAMPILWHRPLKVLAESLGLVYFVSVFSQAGIDFAVELGLPCLKIASFELTDLPLIEAAAKTGLPVILSAGMATYDEVEAALKIFAVPTNPRYIHDDRFVLLKCTSAYPAPLSEMNLRCLATGVQGPFATGLSDHSRSNSVVAAAVALGACVVERHITLSRKLGGPDASFSDEPDEFKEMVRTIRDVEAALGSVHYGPTESEMPMLRFRRSLWAVADVKAGEQFTEANVACLRPTGGLEPREWGSVLGKAAARDVARGEPITADVVGTPRRMIEGW